MQLTFTIRDLIIPVQLCIHCDLIVRFNSMYLHLCPLFALCKQEEYFRCDFIQAYVCCSPCSPPANHGLHLYMFFKVMCQPTVNR
jgi:hypothetical protein